MGFFTNFHELISYKNQLIRKTMVKTALKYDLVIAKKLTSKVAFSCWFPF